MNKTINNKETNNYTLFLLPAADVAVEESALVFEDLLHRCRVNPVKGMYTYASSTVRNRRGWAGSSGIGTPSGVTSGMAGILCG